MKKNIEPKPKFKISYQTFMKNGNSLDEVVTFDILKFTSSSKEEFVEGTIEEILTNMFNDIHQHFTCCLMDSGDVLLEYIQESNSTVWYGGKNFEVNRKQIIHRYKVECITASPLGKTQLKELVDKIHLEQKGRPVKYFL